MITPEQLAEIIDHYGMMASTMYAVPVDRDELKKIIDTLSAALNAIQVMQQFVKDVPRQNGYENWARLDKALEPFNEDTK